jgi:hypothetical protein
MSENPVAGELADYDLFETEDGDWLLLVEPGAREVVREEVVEATCTVSKDGLCLSRDGREIRLAPPSDDAVRALTAGVDSVVVVEMVMGRRAGFYAAAVRAGQRDDQLDGSHDLPGAMR